MRILAAIAVCIALSITSAGLAIARDQPAAESAADTQGSSSTGDELHFVSVLTLQGGIVAVDPTKRFITVKGQDGKLLTLEVEKDQDLAARKVDERVLVRYIEGGLIGKRGAGKAVPVDSLKNGMIGAEPDGASSTQRGLAVSVERVDAANQEITLKGPDGSLETIVVSNPEHLGNVKVGDRVVVTRPQALALSVESAG
jgi:hypothetical protein